MQVTLPAQIQNGQFQGTVLDQSGAAVPSASVTATNEGTGRNFTAQTSQTGFFSLQQLPPGQYTIKVEAPNFKTVATKNQVLNAGVIQRVDFKLSVGQRSETVEVTDIASAVNTEDSKLAGTVSATQVANLPLNGRNIYDLIQLAPGAINYMGGGQNSSEAGPLTVVNGARQNFNGFLINGVSNKDLSGGPNNQPIQDTVQEFQLLTLNNSAQYGNSAGSVTNLVTKTGTNSLHGSLWEFVRNDKFDANDFFLNQAGAEKLPLRFNQFGGTLGGPIIKDKLFFFGAYQGDRLVTSQPAQPVLIESPELKAALAALSGSNPDFQNSVASFMMNQFPASVAGSNPLTADDYVGGGFGFSDNFADYLCPDNYPASGPGSEIPRKFAALFGYTPGGADDAGCANPLSSLGVGATAGLLGRNAPFLLNSVLRAGSQAKDNLFNGNEASARIDYNFSQSGRLFTQFNWQRTDDRYGPFNASLSAARGFTAPTKGDFPNFQLSYVQTFGPRVVNEARVGYTLNKTTTGASHAGVPQIAFDDGATAGFGAYNGYPQFFKDHVYTYSDMVSINRSSHSIKIGADIRRNLENSEFNVGRPSYYFFDPLFFSVDAPYRQAAGVDPGIVSGAPSQLATNVRHWRNIEFGAYVQDDWKIARRLTLNLGLRYDLYSRHVELNDLATTFIKGPGNNIIDSFITGAGQVHDANTPCLFLPGGMVNSRAQLAGECGPGGFAATKELGAGDHNNFGPRVGFAWDVFGDAKTSLRGGYGVSYEGTLYNPLSNSRWNPPFYSFNRADNFLNNGISYIVYGPTICNPACQPDRSVAPSEGGAGANPGQGVGVQNVGNLVGWDSNNPNLAFRSGLIFPEGIRDPYIHNYYLGLQHELVPKVVMELNYVGTAGHKLFRAENINRIPGGLLPLGTCVVDNFGRNLCGQRNTSFYPGTTIPINTGGALNANYGQLRAWLNAANSNYNALQASLRMTSVRGVSFNVNYTWSHSIDDGSTWHSGATTGNGAAAGDGFTTDFTIPNVDRGNSVYDVRHRLVANYVWELPWFNKAENGFLRYTLGGWQLNGIWAYQSGLHWSAFRSSASNITCGAAGCTNAGGDFNLDNERNDRPNYSGPTTFSHDEWANGIDASGFTSPCVGCVGNLGRNSLVGPNLFSVDMSLFKNFKFTERVHLQFRAEGFNVFNRANFLLPGANFAGHNRTNSPLFGVAAGALNPRQMQLGLKLNF